MGSPRLLIVPDAFLIGSPEDLISGCLGSSRRNFSPPCSAGNWKKASCRRVPLFMTPPLPKVCPPFRVDASPRKLLQEALPPKLERGVLERVHNGTREGPREPFFLPSREIPFSAQVPLKPWAWPSYSMFRFFDVKSHLAEKSNLE